MIITFGSDILVKFVGGKFFDCSMTFLKNKKRYAHLVIGNLRNFRFDARDSIVVLTRIAWAAIVTSASWAFSGPPIRRGIVGSRFLFITNFPLS